MSVFEETPTEAPNRTPLVAGLVVVLLLIGGGTWFYTREPAAPSVAEKATPAASPRPAPPAPRKAEPTPEKAPEPAATARREAAPKPAAPAAAAKAESASADSATLTVESDVPGASVFVDREFVGTAPVTLKSVAPGTKRINLSAEGYEGVQRAVEVAAGDNTVTMRFKEVRLNATVGVAHKHGLGGGCEGTLRATVDGLSYQTSNKSDAFTLKYEQVESFDINYLEKNLKVKQRGGKTWNFTDRAAENADQLFVFHRDVQAARDKLSKGYTAAR
ncbi:MAG: PEGA domain-containing protein [Acidobacteriota bacterium]